ncbi:alpha/beta fold hydrolase [Oceanobacillus massiliensis]|uniref:alpha/beta fold hydrolase n=1 Tax=Oceanobacillus massiliensis TaxID=1465765 RepID=UPI0011CBBBA1
MKIGESTSDCYECHLLDLPGMGRSEGIKERISLKEISDWLKGYIDDNRMDKVTLIGHSMGCSGCSHWCYVNSHF